MPRLLILCLIDRQIVRGNQESIQLSGAYDTKQQAEKEKGKTEAAGRVKWVQGKGGQLVRGFHLLSSRLGGFRSVS